MLYNPFNWIKRILIWTNGMIVCLAAINIAIWAVFYLQAVREYQVIDLKPSLISQVYASHDSEIAITDNDVKRQTHLLLGVLHNYSYNNPQDFSPITGLLSPNIISNAETAYTTNIDKMREASLVQAITITQFPLIGDQSNNGRINVIVKGYIIVLTQANNTASLPARTVPYRAELSYVVRPATHFTGHKTLYLNSLTEVAGTRECALFDDAVKSKINLLQ